MRYIVPVTIADSMLVSSSVPETDHPAWSAATAYTAGARVIRVATHSVYERLVSGTTATAPESDAANWIRVGPTSRWAMLDNAVGTTTSATGSISITISPGVVRGLALLDMNVEAVVVSMAIGGDVIYTASLEPIGSQEDCDNYYDYFFEAITRRRTLVIADLPPYAEAEITITATGLGEISIGSLVVGAMYQLGSTLAGTSVGIVDYSRKDVDEFGAITVVERAYSKRMSVPLLLRTVNLDVATQRLARVRAKPVVWIASERLDATVVYGFVKDWSVDIPGMNVSTCSIEIEGLT